VLLRRGDEPKFERLLDFPPPLPLFITRAFPSRITLASVFNLVFFRTELRVERAFALFATVALESCVVRDWIERGSLFNVGLAALNNL
jgi:hypothetical protein